MAVIKRGILGGFQGKIGNVVGTSWKGISVMKAMPLSVANPRTAGQVAQRSAFTIVSQLGSKILATIIKPLNDRFAQEESGYNLFLRRSISAFVGTGFDLPQNIEIARGKLDLNGITAVTELPGNDGVQIAWTSTAGTGNALVGDESYVLILDEVANVVYAGQRLDRGTAGNQLEQIYFPGYVSGQPYYIYLAWRRQDGSMVSNTSYRSFSA